MSVTVDGVTEHAKLATCTGTSGATTASDVTAAVAVLNSAAGKTAFGTGSTGLKIVVASTTNAISYDTTNGGKIGFSSGISGNAGMPASSDAAGTNLADQFNSLLTQIDQLASDANYNSTNLLAGGGSNQLKIQFNENGKSNLQVQGVDFSSAELNPCPVATSGTNSNCQSDPDTNAVLTKLDAASSSLRAQSGTFGSNLTVVQNRQDFTKQLVNILGTGSANLTNADLNEEAANSQALSTRQSMGISALSLANTAQQGVLQLLR